MLYQKKKNDELYHHGIKGQKWGIRRFQDKNGHLTAAGKERAGKNRRYKKTVTELKKQGKAYTENLESYKVAGLTTMITKAGEEYVSGLTNGHDFDWQESINMTRSDGSTYWKPAALAIRDIDDFKTRMDESASRAHETYDFDDIDLQVTNSDFGKPGTTQNCAKCTATLEMRLRGYDIVAGRQTYPSSSDAQSYWFKDAERVDYDSSSATSALSSYGPRTSGSISIQYPGGGGHAMHWSNNSDGVFEIQDGQNGRRFKSVEEMMHTYGADTSRGVSTYRLDNCEPDWDALASDSVLREVSGRGYAKVHNRVTGRTVDTW